MSRMIAMALGLVLMMGAGTALAQRPDRYPMTLFDPAAMGAGATPAPDPVRGRTIRWTWKEGPDKGSLVEHEFREDGHMLLRAVNGRQKSSAEVEQKYESTRVGPDLYTVSYRTAAGATVTVFLNLKDRTLLGFWSDSEGWYPSRGTFEVMK
jgi:molybdenum cofactor biosynthesis MoaF-like protein